MSISLSNVTGGAQTGLTSPTYTVTADTAPDVNGKQWAVTALGGTQATVTAHSVSSPFTLTFFRPKTLRVLGAPNPVTGVVNQVPRNKYVWKCRKGVSVLSGQPIQVAQVNIEIDVPAGSESYDAQNVRAMLSAIIGAFDQVSAGTGDTAINGVM